jgi:hypothetical protein
MPIKDCLVITCLKKINAFNSGFDINIKREKDQIRVIINSPENRVMIDKLIKEGEALNVKL